MAEIVPLVHYITRKRLASPLGFAAGGNIYNAVSQGGVGHAADTLEAMLFGVEVLPEAFEQVTIFAFGSIAPISRPVLGAPTMGVAKNAPVLGRDGAGRFPGGCHTERRVGSNRHCQQGRHSRTGVAARD